MSDVRAVHRWKDNAALVLDAARLGYVGNVVLDVTYGLGKFWSVFKPVKLIRNDLADTRGDYHYDYCLPPPVEWIEQFDTVVFDPPYRLSGARDRDSDERYGTETYTPIEQVLGEMESGLQFCWDCCRPGGTVLVKCQDQTSSGHKVWQTYRMVAHGTALGLTLEDQFHCTYSPRPQPPGRTQRTSRSNYSTLLVFRR